MKVYATEAIRNLAVIGHGDAGKTQLVSSLLFVAGATPRWGKVDEGTTTTDHEEDSIARKITLNTGLAHLEHKETKVNLIDTPGYAAFVSHARPAVRVADCGVVVVDGVKGVEVQTEKVWNYANEFMLPRMMVVTKLDKEHSDIGIALDSAHNVFKRAIVPFTLPIGKEHNFKGVVDVVHMKAYEFDEQGKAKEIEIPVEGRDVVDKTRERIIELVAESDDALLEKYFEQGTLEDSDVLPNITKAIAASKLCPVFAVSTTSLVGLSTLLDHIVEFAPDPAHHEAEHGKNEKGEEESRKYSNSESFSAYCFRTIADPFAGRINVFKVISGRVGTDATVYNCSRSVSERLGALHTMQGKQLDKVPEANAGDIIACVKLKETQTGD
ncbi:MAG: GTP-binding protein, partial [Pyrinomonadaceae bacterium]